MKALPTLYNGVQYRSLLEARYAAFFEMVQAANFKSHRSKPQVDYEPEAFNGYIPDFIIRSESPVLVEVKGELEAFQIDKIKDSGWKGPIICCTSEGPHAALRHEERGGRSYRYQGPRVWDWSLLDLSYRDCDDLYATGPGRHFDHSLAVDLIKFWREAGNLVQWKGVRSSHL